MDTDQSLSELEEIYYRKQVPEADLNCDISSLKKAFFDRELGDVKEDDLGYLERLWLEKLTGSQDLEMGIPELWEKVVIGLGVIPKVNYLDNKEIFFRRAH